MSSAQSVRPELDFSLLLPSSDFDGVEYPRNGFGVEIGQVDGDANTAHCLPFSTMPLMATTPSVYRASHNQPGEKGNSACLNHSDGLIPTCVPIERTNFASLAVHIDS